MQYFFAYNFSYSGNCCARMVAMSNDDYWSSPLAEAYYVISSAYIGLTMMLFVFEMPKWAAWLGWGVGILVSMASLYTLYVNIRDRRAKAFNAEIERVTATIRVDLMNSVGTTEEFAARVNAPLNVTQTALLRLEDRGFASYTQQSLGKVWHIAKQPDRAKVPLFY